MLELDSALAQHIVDRAMAILPHNINVMDAQLVGTGLWMPVVPAPGKQGLAQLALTILRQHPV